MRQVDDRCVGCDAGNNAFHLSDVMVLNTEVGRERDDAHVSKLFTLTCGRNVQLLPILGDGAPGDFNASFSKAFNQFVIRQWLGLIFIVDDLLQLRLHGGPTHRVAGIGLRTTGEEHTQRVNAPRGLEILFADRAADGRHVDTELVRDRGHGQGLECLLALLEELALCFNDDVDDTQQCVLSLNDGFHQPSPVSQVRADKVLCLFVDRLIAHHFHVAAIQLQCGDSFVCQASCVNIVFFVILNDRIGRWLQCPSNSA